MLLLLLHQQTHLRSIVFLSSFQPQPLPLSKNSLKQILMYFHLIIIMFQRSIYFPVYIGNLGICCAYNSFIHT